MAKRAGRPSGYPPGMWPRRDGGALSGRIRCSSLPRKASVRGRVPPVPETDTGGLVEHTKAIGRILVKELGKTLPCLRHKGGPLG